MVRYYIAPAGYRGLQRAERVAFNGGRRLPVDVRVEDDAYVILADVPGLKAEDLKVEILDNEVTLRAEVEMTEEEPGLLLRERCPLSFSRRLRLPDPVEAEKVEAEIENGVLRVRIPKVEEARPKRIEISVR